MNIVSLQELIGMLIPGFPIRSHLRVRQVLDGMTDEETKQLKKLLPASSVKMPKCSTAKYPSALLKLLNSSGGTGVSSGYSALGVIAEEMLQLSATDITLPSLLAVIRKVWPHFHFGPLADAELQKIVKSKTTEPFLTLLVATRRALDAQVDGELQHGAEIRTENIVGHPDARTATHVVEVKLTGQLIKNWTYFKLQTYAYAALDSSVAKVSIVLPLQQTVCTGELSGWTKRTEFAALLERVAQRLLNPPALPVAPTVAVHDHAEHDGCEDHADNVEAVLGAGAALYKLEYGIGCHVGKQSSLVKTIQSLPMGVPSQIFLANPQSAKVSISDLELAQATEALAERAAADPAVALYVHSPYVINLASPTSGYQLECLKTLLAYGSVIGAKGVVVHVGKHTTQTMEAAMAAMRANVAAVLPSATAECPLLLETPAGQGTEMLRSYEEFVGFVKSFANPAFRLCVDTCHVFACGHQPKEYLERLVAEDRDLLALVHFNDSKDICGACKDRHAFAGTGMIGAKTMNAIAELCKTHKIPAVIE